MASMGIPETEGKNENEEKDNNGVVHLEDMLALPHPL